MTIPNLPTLGIRLDINRLPAYRYSVAAWRIIWDIMPPSTIIGSTLYDGDSRATLDGSECVFCIAIQNRDVSMLRAARTALSHSAELSRIGASPLFVEDPSFVQEPLFAAGQISPAGHVAGASFRKLAFQAIPALSNDGNKQVFHRTFFGCDYNVMQEMEGLCRLAPTLPRDRAAAFFQGVRELLDEKSEAVERPGGRLFEGVASSIKGRFTVACTVSRENKYEKPTDGIIFLEYRESPAAGKLPLAILYCAARVSESSFLTRAYVFTGVQTQAMLNVTELEKNERTQSKLVDNTDDIVQVVDESYAQNTHLSAFAEDWIDRSERAIAFLDSCGEWTIEKLFDANRIAGIEMSDAKVREMWATSVVILGSREHPGGHEFLRWQLRQTLIKALATAKELLARDAQLKMQALARGPKPDDNKGTKRGWFGLRRK